MMRNSKKNKVILKFFSIVIIEIVTQKHHLFYMKLSKKDGIDIFLF